MHYCEEIEYLVAFNVGRRYQTLTNNLFTLAGAFSAFRREALYQTYLYSDRTVSEDTDLTFQLKKKGGQKRWRVGCVSSAIAYVRPISSLSRLYSQRLRWQRGQLEVISLHYDRLPGFFTSLLDNPGRVLIADHTLAFLRMTWTFIVPGLYFLGYPLQVVMAALVALYLCYLALDILYFKVAIREALPEYRKSVRRIWWVVFFLPFFRFVTYWFRLAGILFALTEDGSWQVENPVRQLRNAIRTSLDGINRRYQARNSRAESKRGI